jgi:CheY-like chemotaxis protein
LESTSAAEQHDLDFTASIKLPALIAEDRNRLAQDAQIAGAVIADKGAYLSAERLQNGVISMRTLSETVVLIVEDDPDQAALAELRVAAAGYRVALAASVEEMTEALKQGVPDLMLLDVMLPDGDGFDVLGRLRRHPDYALLPIVMLTVKADTNDIQQGLALGADGYVTKPYSKEVLADTIGRVLKRE